MKLAVVTGRSVASSKIASPPWPKGVTPSTARLTATVCGNPGATAISSAKYGPWNVLRPNPNLMSGVRAGRTNRCTDPAPWIPAYKRLSSSAIASTLRVASQRIGSQRRRRSPGRAPRCCCRSSQCSEPIGKSLRARHRRPYLSFPDRSQGSHSSRLRFCR